MRPSGDIILMAQTPYMMIRSVWRRSMPVGMLLALLAATGCNDAPTTTRPTASATAVTAAPASKDSIQFLTDYRQGLETARREDHMVLLFFTAPGCQYCVEMENEVFSDPAIRQLAQQFTCIRADADRDAKLCQQFQVSAFPTVQFVSPLGAPLSRLIGKKPAGTLARHMQQILGAVAQRRGASSAVR